MTAHQQVNSSTMENQAFALMSRLHVMLRREKGRVTDIEYMRQSPVYCNYVIELIRLEGSEQARELGARLSELFFGPHGLFVEPASLPLLARIKAPAAPPLPPRVVVQEATPKVVPDQTYVGRLR
jgi:hypothetical protein